MDNGLQTRSTGDINSRLNLQRCDRSSLRDGDVHSRRLAGLGLVGAEVCDSRSVTIHRSSSSTKLGKLCAGAIVVGPGKHLDDFEFALRSAVVHGFGGGASFHVSVLSVNFPAPFARVRVRRCRAGDRSVTWSSTYQRLRQE